MSKPAPQQPHRPLTDFVGVSAVLDDDGVYGAEIEFLSAEGRTVQVRIEFDVYPAGLPIGLFHAEYRHPDDSEVMECALALVARFQEVIRLELERTLARGCAQASPPA